MCKVAEVAKTLEALFANFPLSRSGSRQDAVKTFGIGDTRNS